jgi:hypothetical protein
MFVCTTCIKRYEGPSVDYVLLKSKYSSMGLSKGRCEFCRELDVCYDLWSGDSNWYPKEKK